MSATELPPGWQWVRFGDVVRNVNNNTRDPAGEGIERVVGLEHLDSDSLPLRRWNELAYLPDGTSFTRMFNAGQVLFGKRRAYQRKVALPDFGGICSGDILVFEPSSAALLPEFLPYVVQSEGFFDHALGTSAGSLSPRTKWQDLAKYEFPLPTVEDQLGITAVMNATDRLAAGDAGGATLYLDLIQSLIHERLFAATSDHPPTRPLVDLVTCASAGSWGVDAGDDEVDCMVIRSTEFTNEASLADVPPAVRSVSEKVLTRVKLSEGDILVERSGGTEDRPVGRVISWTGDGVAIPSNFVHLLRADERLIPPSVLKWTLWYLHRMGATRRFQTASTNMRNLRIKAYLEQPIPVLPLPDALELAQQLDAAEAARRLEETRVAAARFARSRLLAHLLEMSRVQ
jgi:type I restriction enzyme S subunit